MTGKSLLLALPLLTACIPPDNASPGLEGGVWRIAMIDGEAPISKRAEMEFLPDRISATAGCNGLGGEWKAQGHRIKTGPFMSTMMYCEGVMEQERALSDLLSSSPEYRFEDSRLMLKGGGHSVELVRVPRRSVQ